VHELEEKSARAGMEVGHERARKNWVRMYLVLEVTFVEDGCVVRLLQLGELLLEQLALVAGAAVLEPDGDLLGVEPELGSQVHLPAGLQLPLLPEAQLQHLRLLVAQPPLLGVPRVNLAAAPRSPPPPEPRSRFLLPLGRACTKEPPVTCMSPWHRNCCLFFA
jgi:hypothetical protein